MTYQGSLFFNFQATGPVMLIVIDNSKLPEKIVAKGDVIGLYCDGKLIGVNIFNSSDYLTLRLNGLVHNPNEPLINLVHTLIRSALNEDVVLVPSPVKLAKIVSGQGSQFALSVGENENAMAKALTSEDNLKEGTYVLVSPKGTRLDNGNMADDYLSGQEKYVIVGAEVGDISDDSSLGEETYSLKEK
jgi:hypothetical protein